MVDISYFIGWHNILSQTQTAIAGYYVYYGTDSNANPVTAGNYQTTSNYLVTAPMDQTSYYLRLVTVDGAGNNSLASTVFVYTYNGIAPPITLTKTTTADFDGWYNKCGRCEW